MDKVLWTIERDDKTNETSNIYVAQLKHDLEETCKTAQERAKGSDSYEKIYDQSQEI